MEHRLQQRNSPNSTLNQRLANAHHQHQTITSSSQRGTASDSRQQQQRRSPIAGVFPNTAQGGAAAAAGQMEDAPPPLPEKDSARAARYGGSRPGTARQSQQAVPGALPPTPTSSDGEGDA